MKVGPSLDLVLALVRYEPETGDFYWLPRKNVRRTWNTRYAGKRAGMTRKDGYRSLLLGKRASYYIHRLVWLCETGEWPTQEIDHINRNPSDNRFCNLRLADHADNLANRGKQKNNTSGYKWVSWCPEKGMWEAKLARRGVRFFVGYFDDPAEAHANAFVESKRLNAEFARAA